MLNQFIEAEEEQLNESKQQEQYESNRVQEFYNSSPSVFNRAPTPSRRGQKLKTGEEEAE